MTDCRRQDQKEEKELEALKKEAANLGEIQDFKKSRFRV